MDSDSSRLLVIGVLGAMVLIRGWYAACETALTEINDALVHAKAEEDPTWKKLDRLISNPVRLRRSFVMHRILSALFCGQLSCLLLAPPCIRLLKNTGFSVFAAELLAVPVLSVVLTLMLAVLTDLFPGRIALNRGEKFAKICVPSVRLLTAALTPVRALASLLTALLCRITGIPSEDKADVVTEEEIRLMVDAGNETGGIEESQREMINNIFSFDDVAVSDVMTHRKDIVAVSSEATVKETALLATKKGFSRIPVYEDKIDSIIGIVLVKDLLTFVGRDEDCKVSQVMRKAVFVPETGKCRDVFQKMRKEKMQLVIVSDEYGGTAGMVTMEDLLEEIVGNIQDEYDNEEAEMTEISENVYSIAGSADPEDVLPKLGVKYEAEDEYDTMSAYVVHLLGRIPEEGEDPVVEQDGVRYKLLSYEDNWISRIQAEILPETSEKTEEN